MPGRAPTPCPGATAWQCMNPAGVSSAAGIARIPHQALYSTVNPAWSRSGEWLCPGNQIATTP
jgi:hypothetical protein